MTSSHTTTTTFTQDVQNVMRKFKADLRSFAESTGAMTVERADSICHDLEVMALHRYLSRVDIMLYSGESKHLAATYLFNTQNERRDTDRSGAGIWPRVTDPRLFVVLTHTPAYHALQPHERATLSTALELSWSPTDLSTDHSDLTTAGARGYTSNSVALERKDYRK